MASTGGLSIRWAETALGDVDAGAGRAYSWFLHKYGEESARSFRLLLDSLEGLQVFDASAEHHTEVVRVLDRYRGAKLTYVDASSLALMSRHQIKQVWSTDHHLGLGGAEVLPRS